VLEDHRQDLFKGEGGQLKEQRRGIPVPRDIGEEGPEDRTVEERGRGTGKLIRVSVPLHKLLTGCQGDFYHPSPSSSAVLLF